MASSSFSTRSPPLILLIIIIFSFASSSVTISPPRPKNVNVALQTKWKSTSFFLEAGELLAKYRNEFFWSFLDSWKLLPPPHHGLDNPTSDEVCFNKILRTASSILDGPLQSVFHLSLLLRSASPKLVLYEQLAEESLIHHKLKGNEEGKKAGEEEQTLAPPCCWAETQNSVFIDASKLKEWVKTLNIEEGKTLETGEEMLKEGEEKPLETMEIFAFDHVFPRSRSFRPVIILYGTPGTSCFATFDAILSEAATLGLLKYVFRPYLSLGCENLDADRCVSMGAGETLYLGGYGVELALKNMEYKAIDDSDVKKGDITDEARTDDLSEEVRGFIFSKLLERKPDLSDDLLTFRDHLLSSSVSDTMNVWELKDLGYQTAQRIIHASDPLHVMQDINQNFPNLVSSISRLKLNHTIKDEIMANQRMVNPGKNLLALNGALINIEGLDLYSLTELVLGELFLADVISKMKVPSKYAKSLMKIPDPAELTSFRVDFRSDHVHYLNNIEEDAMYRRWRSNLQDLLMPVFPGQMRYIRKNLFHAIYVIDPASPSGLNVIDTILYYYENNVPMRFGILLFSTPAAKSIAENSGEMPKNLKFEKDLAVLVGKLFGYVKENYGVIAAFQFLSGVNRAKGGDMESQNDDPIELSHIEEAFFDSIKSRTKSPPQEILRKLEMDSEYEESFLQSTLFVFKLGLHQMQPCLLLNGLVHSSTSLQGGISAMNEELPRIQESVYFGHINSHTDILDKFLKEGGYLRYNPQIVSTSKEDLKYVSLAKAEHSFWINVPYLHTPGTDDDVKAITHLLVVDASNDSGFQLLLQAVRYLISGSKRGRVGILFDVHDGPTFKKQSPSLVVVRVISSALKSSSSSKKVLPFLHDLLSWYVSHSDTEGSKLDIGMVVEKSLHFAESSRLKLVLAEDFISHPRPTEEEETHVVSTLFGLQPGSNAVVTNGKVFMQNQGGGFTAEDFFLLESVEYDRRVKQVSEIIEQVEWEGILPDDLTSDLLSTAIMGISSAIATRMRGSDTARFDLLQSEHSAIIHESENAPVHVDAIIDPLSPTGQKLTPFFLLLQNWFNASIRILLNPMSSLADLPLKNFYRFVVPNKNPFNPNGTWMVGPVAVFSNMPPTRTLTMNLDVPEPWLVEPIKAIYDLDNIVLEKLGNARTMYAVFELEALMLTGHCHEHNDGPPRGLQLLLGTKMKSHMVDTIVMANLGYWQLKAAPGVWTLRLAPGKSSDLYSFRGLGEGDDSGPQSKQVIIMDLRGELLHLEVVKRKGREGEALLSDDEDEDEQEGKKGNQGWNKELLKWATDLLGGNKKPSEVDAQKQHLGKVVQRKGEPINIFSIASGHLYERFLKIMMLSVLKNTQRPVKFWFIKNYLSPQFKNFIPYMAEEYGFEYGLVTYKWPTWLHKQTEKQRIIWAYKILFLDVIFPLSLKKVIFVDADQIVRADMGELYDMNLKGRPLAYTPFCDNNKEMDGYRFWNQGFWKDHLRGKAYHISALYVVDLAKFRQTAAGDNLRVFYETLSKDPGSLSNLDQDLPNYAQHQVPIFSLPQEWLWCESWCGNATKGRAKTIDLCNNPMTKEPKLQGARRIVAEWPALDEEARRLTARVLGEESDSSKVLGLESESESSKVSENGSYKITNSDSSKASESESPKVNSDDDSTSADTESASEL